MWYLMYATVEHLVKLRPVSVIVMYTSISVCVGRGRIRYSEERYPKFGNDVELPPFSMYMSNCLMSILLIRYRIATVGKCVVDSNPLIFR